MYPCILPRPEYDVMKLKACVKEGRIPSVASAGAAAEAVLCGRADTHEGRAAHGTAVTSAPSCVDNQMPGVTADCVSLSLPSREAHSHYGCPSLLRKFLQSPELLSSPQLAGSTILS